MRSQATLMKPAVVFSLMLKSRKVEKRLTKSGLIFYEPDSALTIRLNREETEVLLGKVHWNKLDDFCEIVHLEISNNCNLNCDYCYADKNAKELTTDEWKRVIKELRDYGVLQVTFGGGEPLLRDDIFELAQYCNEIGLNVTMTTNGSMVMNFDKKLYSLFKQVNVSWRGDDALQALQHLRESTAIGINFIVNRGYIKDLPRVAEKAKEIDAELLLLAYKPVKGDFENVIAPELVFERAKKLYKNGLKVAVDGPCLGKCLAAKRFCDVHSNGDVSVCSFVREPIGNLRERSFKEIWRLKPRNIACPYFKTRTHYEE